MEFLVAAFTLGFLGSLHCVGMCGPIAMALPLGNKPLWYRIAGGLLYNIGRVTTYGVMGAAFGLMGRQFILAGFQQWMSIVLGVLILVLLGIPYILPQKVQSQIGLTKIISPVISKIKNSLVKLFGKQSLTALYGIGVLNGFLPCGLVYMGIAGALATSTPANGSLFMMFFGLGTIPAMLSITQLASFVTLAFRQKVQKVVPLFVACMAVVLIMRGMNMGIPYISPKLDKTDCTKHTCCHKKADALK